MGVNAVQAIVFLLMCMLGCMFIGDQSLASEHGGGEHGEETTKKEPPPQVNKGDGAEKPEKAFRLYTFEGIDECEVPKMMEKAPFPCGSKENEEYIAALEKYNSCMEPFNSRPTLSLKPCKHKVKKKVDTKSLLEVP